MPGPEQGRLFETSEPTVAPEDVDAMAERIREAAKRRPIPAPQPLSGAMLDLGYRREGEEPNTTSESDIPTDESEDDNHVDNQYWPNAGERASGLDEIRKGREERAKRFGRPE